MRFVDREITPRFPDGLSTADARGRWRDSERIGIAREPSKLVAMILPGNGGENERLREIIAAYKRAFRQ